MGENCAKDPGSVREDWEIANGEDRKIRANHLNKAIFLDRDGTINREVDFLRRVEDLRLLPKAASAIMLLRDLGFLVIVISNQSGIARGILTAADLETLQEELARRLKAKGAAIDAFYHCPHHPDGAVKDLAIECSCRKPAPALFKKAAEDFGVDFSSSYAIGDRLRDLIAPKELGCGAILVRTGYGKEELKNREKWPMAPDFIARNLYQGAFWIKGIVAPHL